MYIHPQTGFWDFIYFYYYTYLFIWMHGTYLYNDRQGKMSEDNLWELVLAYYMGLKSPALVANILTFLAILLALDFLFFPSFFSFGELRILSSLKTKSDSFHFLAFITLPMARIIHELPYFAETF